MLLSLIILICFRCCLTCPSVCSCIWKHGKQTADCDGKGLSVIPEDLQAATQVIDISRNNFNKILSKAFQSKGLVNLQKIFLSECGITLIAREAFFQLNNLVELDLSRNKLQTVPSDALSLIPNLRRLQLAHNPIVVIENGEFSSLSQLTYLGLSNCEIKHVKPGALTGLGKLDVFELDGNKITSLSIDVFQSASYLFGLHLDNNPWHCDCKIREIRTWMEDHNIPLSVPPHCESPEYLKGFPWDILSLNDFACVPKILNVPKELTMIAGQNASIYCQVNSIPKSSVYWEVAGKNFKNITSTVDLKLKYNVEEEESASGQTSILTIFNVMESDSDVYTCVAENKAGFSSVNFTLTVLCPNDLNGSWNNSQITLLSFGISFIIILSVAIICLLVYHPISLSFGYKINRKDLQNLPPNKKDAVEISNQGKDLNVNEKQPRHETGSSGYCSDQLTPDLVSKIPDRHNGPSLSVSTFTCSPLHSESPALFNGYGPSLDHWPYQKTNNFKLNVTSPVANNVYSEIYLNPCYGKDDESCNYALQSPYIGQLPDCDRFIPQNDRVQTLRETDDYDSNRDINQHDYRRNPLLAANALGQYTLPPKTFPLDEGYAEESPEGTEV